MGSSISLNLSVINLCPSKSFSRSSGGGCPSQYRVIGDEDELMSVGAEDGDNVESGLHLEGHEFGSVIEVKGHPDGVRETDSMWRFISIGVQEVHFVVKDHGAAAAHFVFSTVIFVH